MPRLGHRLAPSLLLLVGVLGAVGIAPIDVAAATGARRVPKVVLIVGPAGDVTGRYRTEARAAAAIARTYSPDVTEVYSPDATWPAVRAALQGASLVVYLGHGNGWPSRYRDALYPPTQDGFGLNPVAGRGDVAHQYFGEGPIAAGIRLAPDAVVVLVHLCYASGLSEPGLPEGTLAQAKQRVDDYAAGFIAAGASAVIAEAYASPGPAIAAVLAGHRPIETAWRSAPNANGHVLAFESQRSPGFVAEMDPASTTTGFERSIVLRRGLAPSDVRVGARGATMPPAFDAIRSPSLAAIGLWFGTPTLDGAVAGTRSVLRLPYSVPATSGLPAAIRASLRWDPLDLVAVPSPTIPPGADPAPPPSTDRLVAPDEADEVADPADVAVHATNLAIGIRLPGTPGRYRLTMTLFGADGKAFDTTTQALVPSLVVRVTGPVDGDVLAAPTQTLVTGAHVDLPATVINLGVAGWGSPAIAPTRGRDDGTAGMAALLVGHWVDLGRDPRSSGTRPLDDVLAILPPGLPPRLPTDVRLGLVIPTRPGMYLLVMDLMIPGQGSLTATGRPPAIVRILVVDAKNDVARPTGPR